MNAVKRPRKIVNRRHENRNSKNGDDHDNSKDKSNTSSSPASASSSATMVELRGVPVYFPFRPYPCQEAYMNQVLDALHQGENALLESPTGTGKTLSLLCATLAWQREQARLTGTISSTSTASAALSEIAHLLGGGTGASTSKTTAATASSIQDAANSKPKPQLPTILYATRTHSQLSQVVRELRSTRYRPKHAVLASREQLCIHEQVNGSALRNNTHPSMAPTASTINNACNRLNKNFACHYRNNLDAFSGPPIDPSRGDVQGTQPVLDVEDLVSMGRSHRVCPFYHTREAITEAELILLPYNYLFDREARKSLNIPWQGAVVIFDEAHNLESFASEASSFELSGLDIGGCIAEVTRGMELLSRLAVAGDDGVKLDDLVKLKAMLLRLEEFLDLVVKPEGGSFAGEYIFECWKYAGLTFQNHEIFVAFVHQVSERLLDAGGGGMRKGGGKATGVASSGTPKLDHLTTCVKLAFAGSSAMHCLARARAYRVHVTPSSSSSTSNRSPRTLSYWCFAPSLAMRELADLGLRSIIVTSGTLSPISSYSMELGIPFPLRLENPHVVQSNQVHVRVLGRGVSNKVLKSSYERRNDPEYIAELGHTLVALCRIVPDGVLVFFPSYGAMEKCVHEWGGPQASWMSSGSSFGNRSGGGSGGGGGGGKRNFFASRGKRSSGPSGQGRYSFPYQANYSTTASPSSTPTTIWQRLLSHKAIVLEPKSSSDMKDAMVEFDKYIHLGCKSNKGGCLLMGVCRGKISEGIDFANHRARAVVMTGLPFPPYQDPKIKMKREYLDAAKASSSMLAVGGEGFGAGNSGSATISNGVGSISTKAASASQSHISGSEWYSQQAHRAVNQAVGRVIRHRFDYGAVLLMDCRFGESRNQGGLSKWVRPYVQRDEGFGKALSGLVQFFRNASQDPYLNQGVPKKKTKTSLMGDGGRRSQGLRLQYDDEEENGADHDKDLRSIMNNVAVIQTKVNSKIQDPKSASENCSNGQDPPKVSGENTNSYVPPERIIKRVLLTEMEKQKLQKRGKDEKTSEDNQLKSANQVSKEDANSGLAALYSSKKREEPSPSEVEDDDGSVHAESSRSAWESLAKPKSSSGHQSCRLAKTGVSVSGKGGRYAQSKTASSSSDNKDAASIKQSQAAKIFFGAAMSMLTSEHFKMLRTYLLQLKQKETDVRAYLMVVKDLLEMLMKYSSQTADTGAGDLVDLFFPLLPLKRRSAAQSMVLEIRNKASLEKKKKRLALSDNQPKVVNEKRGRTIYSELGGKPSAPQGEEGHCITQKKHTEKMEKRYIASKRARCSLDESLPSAKGRSPERKNAKTGIDVEAEKHIHKQERNEELDAVSACLKQAETYSGPSRSMTTRRRLRANIPEDLACIVCESTPVVEPMLANCGHSACLQCWLRWLKKQNSCPVCRKRTMKTDLARMVFKTVDNPHRSDESIKTSDRKTSDAQFVPTLSQICFDEDEFDIDDGD